MRLTLLRHATLLLDVAGRRLLVDPMLDPAGARPPVANTPDPRPNPLVGLPVPPEEAVEGVDAVLVTHLHADHLDGTAVALLPRGLPLFCQPPDADTLRSAGFGDVRPVGDDVAWGPLRIERTDGRHGTGEIGAAMGPVSGFVVRAAAEPDVYVAGDTIWCEEVERALERWEPEVVVVNAGGARFVQGDPITMTAEDVIQVARAAPAGRVVAVHMEAINHCGLDREALRRRLADAGMGERVLVPGDGETIDFSEALGGPEVEPG